MAIFVATLVAFLVAFLALSIGIIFGGTRIKGHCGAPSLDDGCCESEPKLPDWHYTGGSAERCVVDEMGNMLQPCDSCICEE